LASGRLISQASSINAAIATRLASRMASKAIAAPQASMARAARFDGDKTEHSMFAVKRRPIPAPL
jgi:hypothetical protein